MKTKYLLASVLIVGLLLVAGLITSSINSKKLCSASKACPTQQKKRVIQPQGSSPDELHYGGLNRLIVSTVR